MKTPNPEAIIAWARLLRAQRLLLGQVEGALKGQGLPPLAWYDALYELHQSPDRRLRQFEIGERMLLSKFNLSRLIDRLVAKGLVRREDCPEDKRGAYVVLTKAGHAMLRKIWPVYAAALQSAFADHYAKRELKTLADLLGRVAPPRSL